MGNNSSKHITNNGGVYKTILLCCLATCTSILLRAQSTVSTDSAIIYKLSPSQFDALSKNHELINDTFISNKFYAIILKDSVESCFNNKLPEGNYAIVSLMQTDIYVEL